MGNYPFTILDVAEILKLNVRRRQLTNIDVDCPFCGHKKGKMNINFAKNVFRCNYCNESGGMIDLYAKLYHISTYEAFNEICEILKCNKDISDYEKPIKQHKEIVSNLEQKEKADLDTRHRTYTALLPQLILTDYHKENLINRGLSNDQIVKYSYKSTPAFGFDRLVATLVSNEYELDGVPGFYTKKNNTYGINFNKKTTGILIPICSITGKIEGFQIRLDKAFDDRKYIWFSSSNHFRGTSVGGPAHFIGNPLSKTVYVTEGALKANIAHVLSGKTFIAVPGVNHYKSLESIFTQLKQTGTTDIVEAYDMDKYTNIHVEKACMNMICLANNFGFNVHRLKWNDKYKGIDDWLYSMNNK